MSEELYSCRMWRETKNAEDVVQVHVFADQYEAQGNAQRLRAKGQRAHIMQRFIKVAGCRVETFCLIRYGRRVP